MPHSSIDLKQTPVDDVEQVKMAKYEVLPIDGLSPYLNSSRYENPKEIFKASAKELKNLGIESGRFLDVACANGELLYYFLEEFPDFDFTGVDFCQNYIEVAQQESRLKVVNFICQDFFSTQGQYDIVTFHGTMPAFKDFRPPLTKLLDLTKPGGYLLLTGYFNPYDIDMQIEFCDSSTSHTENIWRSDYNFHSQKSVSNFLNDKCEKFSFSEVPMPIDLPFDKGRPHLDSFTFKDADQKIMITNGMNLILNDYHLTIKK